MAKKKAAAAAAPVNENDFLPLASLVNGHYQILPEEDMFSLTWWRNGKQTYLLPDQSESEVKPVLKTAYHNSVQEAEAVLLHNDLKYIQN
jgi:hypothetical protein